MVYTLHFGCRAWRIGIRTENEIQCDRPLLNLFEELRQLLQRTLQGNMDRLGVRIGCKTSFTQLSPDAALFHASKGDPKLRQ